MSAYISNMRSIKKVLIIDDDEASRKGFSYIIEDVGLEPVCQDKPLTNIDLFLKGFSKVADAVLSDYRLIPGNFSVCQGDSLVSSCVKRKIPAVLCSSLAGIDLFINRLYLRHIPAFIRTSNPDIDQLQESFSRCIDEISGKISSSRKAWRTLIRIDEINKPRQILYVVVPAWDSRQKICITYDSIPDSIKKTIKQDKRYFAKVNIGAEACGDLYFDEWENE